MSLADNLLLLTTAGEAVTLNADGPVVTFSAGSDVTLEVLDCPIDLSADEQSISFNVEGDLVLETSPIDLTFAFPCPVGTGEPNEGANVGGGVEVFKQKTGVVLEFRTLVSLSPEVKIEQKDDTIEVSVPFVWDEEPQGAKDDSNLTYTLDQDAILQTIRVYREGVRLFRDQAGACDYMVTESGGVGTGYDTIVITDKPLIDSENLVVDYVAS